MSQQGGDRIWLGIALAILLALPSPAVARRPGPVVVSEVAWAGSSVSSADEWIEFTNVSDTLIDLAGWQLWDTSDKEEQILLTIESGLIAPHGTFLIANNTHDHAFTAGESALGVPPDLVVADLQLSNSSLQLELGDADGDRVDEVGDGSPPFAGDRELPASMVRSLSDLDDGDEEESWSTALESVGFDDDLPDLGTPLPSGRPTIVSVSCNQVWTGQEVWQITLALEDRDGQVDLASVTFDGEVVFESSTPEGSQATDPPIPSEPIEPESLFPFEIARPAPGSLGPLPLVVGVTDRAGLRDEILVTCFLAELSTEILLSEVYPAPAKGEGEFLELHNVGDVAVNLVGWQLDDIADGGSRPYRVEHDLTIQPGEYRTVAGSESGLIFNNDGDTVRLLNPLGQVASLVSCPRAKTAESYSWTQNNWAWVDPTPGRENALPDSPPVPAIAVASLSQGGNLADSPLSVETLSLEEFLQLRSELAGKTVAVDGIVSVLPEDYHDRRLILADGVVAIEVQFPELEVPTYRLGDRLRIQGQVSRASEPRLLTKSRDVSLVGTGSLPLITATEEWQPGLFQLVSVSGTLASSGHRRIIRVGQREVAFSTRSGLTLPELHSGDEVTMKGLVVTLDPLLVRILRADDVRIDRAAEPEMNTPIVLAAPAGSELAPTMLAAAPVAAIELASVSTEFPPQVVPDLPPLVPTEPLVNLVERTRDLGQRLHQARHRSDQLVALVASRRENGPSPASSLGLTLALFTACLLLLLGGDWLWQSLRLMSARSANSERSPPIW